MAFSATRSSESPPSFAWRHGDPKGGKPGACQHDENAGLLRQKPLLFWEGEAEEEEAAEEEEKWFCFLRGNGDGHESKGKRLKFSIF